MSTALRLATGIVQHGIAKVQQRQIALQMAQAEAMNAAFDELQRRRMEAPERSLAYTRPPLVMSAAMGGPRAWSGDDVPLGMDQGMVRLAAALGQEQAERDVALLKEAVSAGALKSIVQRSAASPERLMQFAGKVERSAVGAAGGLAPVRSMGMRGAVSDAARRESSLRAAQPGIGVWAPKGGAPGQIHRDAFGNASSGSVRWTDPAKMPRSPAPIQRDVFGNASAHAGTPAAAPAPTAVGKPSMYRTSAKPAEAPVAAPAQAAAPKPTVPGEQAAQAPVAAPGAPPVVKGRGFLGNAKRTAIGLGLGGLGLYAGGKVMRGGLNAMSGEAGPAQYGSQGYGASTVAYGVNEFGQPDLRSPFVQH